MAAEPRPGERRCSWSRAEARARAGQGWGQESSQRTSLGRQIQRLAMGEALAWSTPKPMPLWVLDGHPDSLRVLLLSYPPMEVRKANKEASYGPSLACLAVPGHPLLSPSDHQLIPKWHRPTPSTAEQAVSPAASVCPLCPHS